MKLMPSRRFYRLIFRRTRLYLPIVGLVLLLMVLFLPLSSNWMTRRTERELKARTGLDIRLERLELILADARVQAHGIELRGEPNTEPFRVRFVEAKGRLAGLLAGGERWPDVVTITAPPSLKLERNSSGVYTLEGEFRTLVESVRRLVDSRPAGESRPTSSQRSRSRRLGRTPALELNDLRVLIDSPDDAHPDIGLTFDRILVQERPTSDSPVRINLRGVVSAFTSERFNLGGTWYPEQDRIELAGSLTGLRIPFRLPALGLFEMTARDLSLDVNLTEEQSGVYTGAMTLDAPRFQVARAVVGGERWNDRDLSARVRFRFDSTSGRLEVGEVSFLGEQIDVALRGVLDLEEGFPGRLHLTVNRLPADALALGRNELFSRFGINIQQGSNSPTLKLEVRTAGLLTQPLALETEASIDLRDWAIAFPQHPEPVNLRALSAAASMEQIQLGELRLEFGDARLVAAGSIPILKPGGIAPTSDTINLRLDGRAETIVELLDRFDILPPAISAIRAPLRIDGTIPLLVERSRGSTDGSVRLSTETLTASIAWSAGELQLRKLPDVIALEEGSMRLTSERLAIQRLRARTRSLALSVNGALPDPWNADLDGTPEFEGSLVTSGQLQDLVFVASRLTTIPRLPSDLRGNSQLEFNVDARSRELMTARYDLRLLLDGVGMTVPVGPRLLPISDLSAELRLTPDLVQLSRLSARVPDPATGESTLTLNLAADENEIRLDGGVRTRLELLTSLLDKDLSDLVMEGTTPATGWLIARPRDPLPPGPGVARRWAAFFMQRGLRITEDETTDLILDYEARYRPEGPITVFAREFPVPISNIRGGAMFTPGEGITFTDVQADIGSARDARISGRVRIGKPTQVEFNGDLDHLNLNEWLEGWGTRPWASKPVSYPPRWRSNPDPVPFVRVVGNITAGSVDFLQFRGEKTSAQLEVQAWSRQPVYMWLRGLEVNAYGGTGYTEQMSFVFPRGENAWMETDATIRGADLKGFMDHLYERPQAMDGTISANMRFKGQLLNYPTYEGEANYVVLDSSVVGSVFLAYWKELLQGGSQVGSKDSTIDGRVTMADQRVNFIGLNIVSPIVNITADGHVDFRGRLNFEITASVISKRLRTIPVISLVGDLWDFVGRQIISYRLEGTLKAPRYYAVPTVVTRLQDLRRLGTREPGTVPVFEPLPQPPELPRPEP